MGEGREKGGGGAGSAAVWACPRLSDRAAPARILTSPSTLPPWPRRPRTTRGGGRARRRATPSARARRPEAGRRGPGGEGWWRRAWRGGGPDRCAAAAERARTAAVSTLDTLYTTPLRHRLPSQRRDAVDRRPTKRAHGRHAERAAGQARGAARAQRVPAGRQGDRRRVVTADRAALVLAAAGRGRKGGGRDKGSARRRGRRRRGDAAAPTARPTSHARGPGRRRDDDRGRGQDVRGRRAQRAQHGRRVGPGRRRARRG